jgi:glutathione S-transferase
MRLMVLYTCPDKESLAALGHPCAKAAKALDAADHHYEMKTVQGGILKPWTWPSRGRDRAEIKRLSGQNAVPILVLDEGNVISGSGNIARWAKEHSSQAGGQSIQA